MGKKLEQARVYLAKGDYEWRFSLSATLFEFRNVSLPKTVSSSDDSSDPLAWEAKILERIGMSEEVMQTIDELFRMFLKIRISSGWSQEKAGLKAWIAKGAEN
jgi:recombination associated protein RdgC